MIKKDSKTKWLFNLVEAPKKLEKESENPAGTLKNALEKRLRDAIMILKEVAHDVGSESGMNDPNLAGQLAVFMDDLEELVKLEFVSTEAKESSIKLSKLDKKADGLAFAGGEEVGEVTIDLPPVTAKVSKIKYIDRKTGKEVDAPQF